MDQKGTDPGSATLANVFHFLYLRESGWVGADNYLFRTRWLFANFLYLVPGVTLIVNFDFQAVQTEKFSNDLLSIFYI
jgi:hypothetical protein